MDKKKEISFIDKIKVHLFPLVKIPNKPEVRDYINKQYNSTFRKKLGGRHIEKIL